MLKITETNLRILKNAHKIEFSANKSGGVITAFTQTKNRFTGKMIEDPVPMDVNSEVQNLSLSNSDFECSHTEVMGSLTALSSVLESLRVGDEVSLVWQAELSNKNDVPLDTLSIDVSRGKNKKYRFLVAARQAGRFSRMVEPVPHEKESMDLNTLETVDLS